jgi:predicted enzyme related to lactoylglutathione lyase
VTRFNFIKLPVVALDAQAAFYTAAFGFAEQQRFENDDFEEAILTQEGDGGLMLCLMRLKHPPESAAQTIGVLGFLTEDIDMAMTRAMDAGATLKQGVFEIAGGTKIALVDDPEGHEIEFVQFG